MKNGRTGVTLVELMLAVLLMGILLTPLFMTFWSSSRISIRGVRQIDLVLEGQRILRQVHDDLQAACLVLPMQSTQVEFTDLVEVTAATDHPGGRVSLLRFPLHAPLEAAISADRRTGPAPRLASRVTYTAEPGPAGTGEFHLIRREVFHPRLGQPEQKAVLTRNLNFFRVAPVEIADATGEKRRFFQVTLQVATTRDGRLRSSPAGEAAGEEGLFVADFFDVVCPDFFAALWNHPYQGRSWYSAVESPD